MPPSKPNPRRCFLFLFVALIVTLLLSGHLKRAQQLQKSSRASIDISFPHGEVQKSSRASIDISFPHGEAVRDDVLTAGPWIPPLQAALHNMSSTRLNMVVSDDQFKSVLFNWLIVSLVKLPRPLDNVLVIALDPDLHTLLEERGITSVYVDKKTIVSADREMKTPQSHIWIIRTTVFRLISHWGYDIAIFDTDAILIKNPTDLFDSYGDVDIVGSAGTFPFPLGEKWGVTLCMGVALFRHTHKTELLWEILVDTKNVSLDDQIKVNYALDACDVHWSATDASSEAVLGTCAENKLDGLRVVILPHSLVCRRTPCFPSAIILHPNSHKDSKAKMRAARSQGVWYLRNDWAAHINTAGLTGATWLRHIAV